MLLTAVMVLAVAAAACGNSSDEPQQVAVEYIPPAGAQEPAGTSGDFVSTRPGTGIAAAGGNPATVQGSNPCPESDTAGTEPVTISYVGADLGELETIGLEGIVVEEPGLIISAYVNAVNLHGGINGHCMRFTNHHWSLTDPVGSLSGICTEVPQQQPVFYFMLSLFDTPLECLTLGAQIPAVGLYASTPDSTLVRTRRLLFIADGTVERILSHSLHSTLTSGIISGDDRVGLLMGSGPSAGIGIMATEARITRAGLDHVATARIPPEFANPELLLSEKQVRLLETGLSDDERAEAEQNLASLPPELAEQFTTIEDFYTEAAQRFADAGVTAVTAVSHWADLRRMMRVAESIGWFPKWIANDIQPATVALADVPRRQAQNLVQVSSRRAAGDEIDQIDRGCVTLRNSMPQAPRFTYRAHTDAWNMMTAICDYLDVTFSALTRIDGPITQDAFVDAMNNTDYRTAHGAHITFSPANRSGAELARVLQADPDCVLNSWGCMRSTSNWLHADGSTATTNPTGQS